MIDELIQRSATATGLSTEQSRLGLSAALSLIQKHGDPTQVGRLFEHVPGAADLATEAAPMTAQKAAGLLGGLIRAAAAPAAAAMSDAMAIGQKLAKQGVTTSDMQNILPVAMDFVREKTGADMLRDVLTSIPGLGPLMVASN